MAFASRVWSAAASSCTPLMPTRRRSPAAALNSLKFLISNSAGSKTIFPTRTKRTGWTGFLKRPMKREKGSKRVKGEKRVKGVKGVKAVKRVNKVKMVKRVKRVQRVKRVKRVK